MVHLQSGIKTQNKYGEIQQVTEWLQERQKEHQPGVGALPVIPAFEVGILALQLYQ